MSSSSDAMFSLSTEVAPPKVFAIDGDSYLLKDLIHLSDVDEGHFRVLVEKEARNSKLLTAAVERGDEVQAQKIGLMIRINREALIEVFTNLPMELIKRLGPVNQGNLIQAIMQGPEVLADRLRQEEKRRLQKEEQARLQEAGLLSEETPEDDAASESAA